MVVKKKVAVLVLHRETGAPQPQRLAQGRAGDRLPADRQGSHIAGGGQRGHPEPALRCGKVRGEAQPFQQLFGLRGGKLDRVSKMIGLPVGAAVHGDEVGDGAAPDVFAGFRLPVGDGKIAGSGGGVVIVQHLRLHRVHQRRQPGVILFVGCAPVAAQDRVGQVALPPGRVRRQPPGSGVGCVIPAVERVAVGGNGLCLERFVRPRDRHLRRHCPDQILPPRHRRHGSVPQVPDEEALAVLIGGRRGKLPAGQPGRMPPVPGHSPGPPGPPGPARQWPADTRPAAADCPLRAARHRAEKRCVSSQDPSRTGSFVSASVAEPPGEKAQISSSS